MAQTFAFTIKVVGTGKNEQEAWEDAKQVAEQKVAEDTYDESERIE